MITLLASPALADGSWSDECRGFAVESIDAELAQDARVPVWGRCEVVVDADDDPTGTSGDWPPTSFAHGPWEPGRTYTLRAFDRYDDVVDRFTFTAREGGSAPPVAPVVDTVVAGPWEYGPFGGFRQGYHRRVEITVRNVHPEPLSGVGIVELTDWADPSGTGFSPSITFRRDVWYEDGVVAPDGWALVGLAPDGAESDPVFVPVPSGLPAGAAVGDTGGCDHGGRGSTGSFLGMAAVFALASRSAPRRHRPRGGSR